MALVLMVSMILVLPLSTVTSANLPALQAGSETITATSADTEQSPTVTSTITETPFVTHTSLPIFTATPQPTTTFDVTAASRFSTAAARHINDPYFATATAIASVATLAYRPLSGDLIDDQENSVAEERTFLTLKNSIIYARFLNAATRHGYYGFLFRDKGSNKQYRIALNYYQQWFFGYGAAIQASGASPWIDASPQGFNDLLVVVKDDTLLLFINGNFVYRFFMDKPNDIGDVAVFAGVYAESSPSKQHTVYQNLTVWALP